MTVTPSYRSFVLEQLEQIFPITAKNMFGGVGLYAKEYFFALIADDRLYFKVDDSNRPDFEAAAMEPFRPYADGRSMQYYEVPIARSLLESFMDNRDTILTSTFIVRRANVKQPKGGVKCEEFWRVSPWPLRS